MTLIDFLGNKQNAIINNTGKSTKNKFIGFKPNWNQTGFQLGTVWLEACTIHLDPFICAFVLFTLTLEPTKQMVFCKPHTIHLQSTLLGTLAGHL